MSMSCASKLSTSTRPTVSPIAPSDRRRRAGILCPRSYRRCRRLRSALMLWPPPEAWRRRSADAAPKPGRPAAQSGDMNPRRVVVSLMQRKALGGLATDKHAAEHAVRFDHQPVAVAVGADGKLAERRSDRKRGEIAVRALRMAGGYRGFAGSSRFTVAGD